MSKPMTEQVRPYAQAARHLVELGWPCVVPVAYGKKSPPLPGLTGKKGMDTDAARVAELIESHGGHNVALRLPACLIGLDVDVRHDGHKTIKALESELGPLPPTYYSTSRDDGSGIYLFTVPPGLRWRDVGVGVETIWRDYRYMMVAPSVHPEKRVYGWRHGEHGAWEAPMPSRAPSLPGPWVEFLTTPAPCAAPASTTSATSSLATCDDAPLVVQSREGYAAKLLDEKCATIAAAPEGKRNGELNAACYATGRLVAGLHLDEAKVVERYTEAALASGLEAGEIAATIASGLDAGMAKPRAVIDTSPPPVEVFQQPTLPGLESAGSDKAVDGVRKLKLTPASEIRIRPVLWLWAERIPLGAFTLLGGREGIGKSTVAYTLAADVTRGRLAGAFRGVPKAVIVAATEDSWEHTIVPRLMAAGADLDRVYRVEVSTSNDVISSLVLPSDLPALTRSVRDLDAAVILLDPLMSRLDTSLDTHKDGDVRRALEPLVQLADETRAAVVGIIHVNKKGETDPLTMLMGSRAFVAVARAVMFVMTDPEDENRRLLGQPKNNLGRTDLPTLVFGIVEVVVAQTNEGPVTTGRLCWLGESGTTLTDALALTGGDSLGIRDAAEWLRGYLIDKGGQAYSGDVKKAARGEDISESTLKRARRTANVVVVSEGMPRRTIWRHALPVPSGASPGESGPTD